MWVRYAADFEKVLAAEREGWRRLVPGEVEIGGEKLEVEHSVFDVGEARHLFDGEDASLVRTASANPAVVALGFDPPRPLRELVLTLGSMQCEIRVDVSGPAGAASFAQVYRDLPPDPTVTVPLPSIGGPVARLRFTVRDVNAGEPQHVHLREVRLR